MPEKRLTVIAEISALNDAELAATIAASAEIIVRNTQGDSWDDPKEWLADATELAHAVFEQQRRLRETNPLPAEPKEPMVQQPENIVYRTIR